MLNSLAVLAAASLAGADLALAALALANLKPATGRGARIDACGCPGGSALLIDESYNANPASMAPPSRCSARRRSGRTAAASPCSATCWNWARRAPRCTAALAAPIERGRRRSGVLPGPLMQALWEALPSGRRGGYAETAAALEPAVLAAIRAGDAVMVKGSLGSKMGPIVKALERQFAGPAAIEQAPIQS